MNKEGTVAVGNLLNEGEGYKELSDLRKSLIDSLAKESELNKKASFSFEKEAQQWKAAFNEAKVEKTHMQEKFDLREEFLNAEVKRQGRKKWTWATIAGIIGILTGILAGI